MTSAILAAKRERLKTLDPADTGADAVMARATDMAHRDWLILNERRMKLRRVWSAFFREWDVLLSPVIATAALPHMQEGAAMAGGIGRRHIQSGQPWERRLTVDGRDISYNDMLFWPGLTAGCHLPATVIPIARTSLGLPLGVQISGPIYGDRTTIAAAALFEQAGYRFQPPPASRGPEDNT